jgi:hypothetical protein
MRVSIPGDATYCYCSDADRLVQHRLLGTGPLLNMLTGDTRRPAAAARPKRIGGVHKSPTCCGLFRYRGRGPGCLQGDDLLVELGHLDRLLDHRANYRQDAKLGQNLQPLAELVMLGPLLALAVQLDAVSEGMYANQVAELGAIGAPFAQEGQPFGGQHQGAVVDVAELVGAFALIGTGAEAERQPFHHPDVGPAIDAAGAPDRARLQQVDGGQDA